MFPTKLFEYELRRRRGQRSIRVSVHAGGRVLVTAGLMMPVVMIEQFLVRKRSWIASAVEKMGRWEPGLLSKNDPVDYRTHKEAARKMIEARLAHFNIAYRHRIGCVSIKNHRRLWGSCSRSRSLNFNYKLVHLPQELADYVIVHELCHLAVFNHSAKFWQLVERAIPDWRVRRKQLRHIGNGKLG